MQAHDLNCRLHGRPFRPFRIHLTNPFLHRFSELRTIDVSEPGSIIVAPKCAIVPIESSVDDQGFRIIETWKTVEFTNIAAILDIN
jgi:hypothetical protein